MKNNLSDLSNHLFAILETLNDDDVTGDKLDETIRRAEASSDVADKIIRIAGAQIQAMKLVEENALPNGELPALIAVKDSEVQPRLPKGATA